MREIYMVKKLSYRIGPGFFLNFCVFPSLQHSKQLHKRIIIKFQLDQVLNIPIQYQVQQLLGRQQQLLLQPQYPQQ